MNIFESLGDFGGSEAFKGASESLFGDNLGNDLITGLFDSGAKSAAKKEAVRIEDRRLIEAETRSINERMNIASIEAQAHIESNKAVYGAVVTVVVVIVAYLFFRKKK